MLLDTNSNTFGNEFRLTTFGESHGPYIGVVIDGVRPGVEISLDFIQAELNRRKPGQSSVATPRNEPDTAEIISGVFEGKTTGTPLCILIKNQDQRSGDYNTIAEILRPGHASFTYLKKFGVFDYRGGGRASGRETALRVAAGAVAKQFFIMQNIEIIGFTRQVGHVISKLPHTDAKREVIEGNIVRAPDMESADRMIELIHSVKDEGDSIGGIVEIIVRNCPPGLGEPIYHKLDADLASALMSLGAVKGFEIGDGFKTANKKGSENNDAYGKTKDGQLTTKTNHAGGILGGITNGNDIVMRIAVKPASSISKKMMTANQLGDEVAFGVTGRHDPCICPRVVPVAEAMVALVLIDHFLLQERIISLDKESRIINAISTIETQIQLLDMQKELFQNKLKAITHEQ